MREAIIQYNNLNRECVLFNEILETLKTGGSVIFPTETIYGIGVDATNEHAISNVFKMKKRDRNKPLSIFVGDMKMARKVACIDSKAERILSRIWPGPITVILRKKDAVPYSLTAGEEKIALRISDNIFIKKLFEKINFPITATSANLSGEKNIVDSEDIKKVFSSNNKQISPDIFVNAGNISSATASTIIDLSDVNNPKLVRSGVFNWSDFCSILNNLNKD